MGSYQDEGSHRLYLVALFLVLVLLASCVFSLNWMVDPLWFGRGNRLGEKNFIYNERVSKLNRFMRNRERYDCAVLGDSRASLLDADALEGSRCFNLAFAGGNLKDLVVFARYLKSRGGELRRVVIGIGMFNFADQPLPEVTPAFIVESRPPPPPLENYFSIEVFRFSLRSLFGRSPTPIYYDRDFRARILREVGSFDGNPALRAHSWKFYMNPGPFSLERMPLLTEALATLEASEYIGYVPPVTARFILELEKAGTLESYLEGLLGLSEHFSVFLDFSIPSPITRDPALTYDGQHFYAEVNARIVESLNHGVTDFGVDVKATSREEYRRRYAEALAATPTVQ